MRTAAAPLALQLQDRAPPLSGIVDARRLQQSFWIVSGAVLLGIVVKADSFEVMAGALLITLAGLVPAYLWLRQGAVTLPIFPVVASTYILYFAFPLISDHPELYIYDEVQKLEAGLTVFLFLLVATLGWVVAASRRADHRSSPHFDASGMQTVIAGGLLVGVTFNALALGGQLGFLGEWHGVVRALVWNLLFAVTFVLGVLQGEGPLRTGFGRMCVAAVALNVLLAWLSLFLVAGLLLSGVFFMGYVLGARRIPVKALALFLGLAFLLHAGKPEMRERYWSDGFQTGGVQVTDVPGRLLEWVGAGAAALTEASEGATLTERASLVQMLLRAQSMTPDPVPYLGGETYLLIPQILAPRVLVPDKPATQAGMDLLNVRYGVLSREEVATTAVGWGLLSEAYVNFGLPGVLICGAVLGLFLGAVTAWSRGAPPLSMRTMFGVVVLAVSVSLEADAAIYVTSLFQAGIAIVALSQVIGVLCARRPEAGPMGG